MGMKKLADMSPEDLKAMSRRNDGTLKGTTKTNLTHMSKRPLSLPRPRSALRKSHIHKALERRQSMRRTKGCIHERAT